LAESKPVVYQVWCKHLVRWQDRLRSLWRVQQSERFATMLNTNFLFASLFWGSVGVAYFIYGKKQDSWLPMVGGVLMIAASYFISSAVLMSLVCIGLVSGVYVLLKRGY
jgi:uncharacterized membrane protein HdeD (DUF308 family)